MSTRNKSIPLPVACRRRASRGYSGGGALIASASPLAMPTFDGDAVVACVDAMESVLKNAKPSVNEMKVELCI